VEAKLKRYALQAFDTYDPTKNVKLSTHVVNYLQKINRDNYTNQQAIRLPENLAIGYSKFMGAHEDLSGSLGRPPTKAELAEHLGWKQSEVAKAFQRYHKEFVEGKQQFDAGVSENDTSASAIRFAMQGMSEVEKKIFVAKTGYGGKPQQSMEVLRRELKLTPYQFYQAQLSLKQRLSRASQILGKES
jgi:DNA-directed RNA polymerase specialized sigma subunit